MILFIFNLLLLYQYYIVFSMKTVLHPMHTVLSFLHDLHKWLISAHSRAVIDTKGFYYGTKHAHPHMGEPPLNFEETEECKDSMKFSEFGTRTGTQ